MVGLPEDVLKALSDALNDAPDDMAGTVAGICEWMFSWMQANPRLSYSNDQAVHFRRSVRKGLWGSAI